MSSLKFTEFLKPMKRKGEVLSIKSLKAQIDAIMQAICLIEDEGSRIQFMKRIEVVKKDLHRLCSKLETQMPRNLKQSSTLYIDHSLRLIGSSGEGYIPLTDKIWQNVMDITQRIDRLSEGLAFVVQRHRRHLQISKFNGDIDLQSDYSGYFGFLDYAPSSDSDLYDTMQQSAYADELGGTNYFFEYSQSTSDGHQVQISFSHAKHYYHPSSNPKGDQHNHLTRGPNYINPQPTNVIPYDRFTNSSPQLEAARYNSRGYFKEYPSESDNLSYLPEGRYRSSSQMPPRTVPSVRRIPTDVASNLSEFNNHPLAKYRDEECSLREYPRNYEKTGVTGVRHTDIIRYNQY